ncbi:MAG: hypothetical protein A4S12_06820 [Proteobacteria bacterium SG_bin5]|nr:type II toxin-antitoxin system VapB family antitoxin [Sphingomonas sp.]OQW42447.1 MAG: hypothetical protein A4S12_06820 [Proteobacteria bacterium SG_bin5]
MGAELKITDAETLRLAQSLAAARGESVEATIRAALEREQAALAAERQAKVEAILDVARRLRESIGSEWDGFTSEEIGKSIYSPDGLPRRDHR